MALAMSSSWLEKASPSRDSAFSIPMHAVFHGAHWSSSSVVIGSTALLPPLLGAEDVAVQGVDGHLGDDHHAVLAGDDLPVTLLPEQIHRGRHDRAFGILIDQRDVHTGAVGAIGDQVGPADPGPNPLVASGAFGLKLLQDGL